MRKKTSEVRSGLFLKGIFNMLVILLILGNITQASVLRDTTKEDSLKEEAPNIFLDCSFCDTDHIKEKINYVKYVRDRSDADVHVMITREGAANKGTRYSLYMIGQKRYEHMQDTLRFNVGPDVSEEKRREKMLHALKTGLTSYLIKTPLWQNLDIKYARTAETEAIEEVEDKWNYWIFEIGFNGYLNGEESKESYDIGGDLEANKVTKDIKLDFRLDADYSKSIYEVNGETITSIHRSYNFNGLSVWSISQHWSAGGFAGIRSSRYRNIAISYSASPAIEFSVFPYSKSTTRQLTFLYRPQFVHNTYEDTTIFNKIREDLYNQNLSIDYEVKKKWGSIDFSLDLSNYFHDFSKNRVSFGTNVTLNLVKGLNIYFYGNASLINDQLSLPQGNATTEEILTRQQELATKYSYYSRIGISYTFGSMYNNVVNTRF